MYIYTGCALLSPLCKKNFHPLKKFVPSIETQQHEGAPRSSNKETRSAFNLELSISVLSGRTWLVRGFIQRVYRRAAATAAPFYVTKTKYVAWQKWRSGCTCVCTPTRLRKIRDTSANRAYNVIEGRGIQSSRFPSWNISRNIYLPITCLNFIFFTMWKSETQQFSIFWFDPTFRSNILSIIELTKLKKCKITFIRNYYYTVERLQSFDASSDKFSRQHHSRLLKISIRVIPESGRLFSSPLPPCALVGINIGYAV